MTSPHKKPPAPAAEQDASQKTLRNLLGETRMLKGENLDDYNELYERVSNAIGPRDPFEEIYVDDQLICCGSENGSSLIKRVSLIQIMSADCGLYCRH